MGRIRSLTRYITRNDGVTQCRKGIIKTPKKNTDGYLVTTLCKDGEEKNFGIHILVAKHFIENPYNYPEVNHKDFDRKNNRVENLEWTTHQDNIKYSKDNNRYKMRDFNGKNNPNYGNHILSKIYRDNPQLAIEKLARPQSQNGRAVKIELYDSNMNYIETFDWIGGCAEYLKNNNYTNAAINSIRSNITSAINNKKKYLNHYYKKLA